jgi:hypothetical protein
MGLQGFKALQGLPYRRISWWIMVYQQVFWSGLQSPSSVADVTSETDYLLGSMGFLRRLVILADVVISPCFFFARKQKPFSHSLQHVRSPYITRKKDLFIKWPIAIVSFRAYATLTLHHKSS